MLYHAYQAFSDALAPARWFAAQAVPWLDGRSPALAPNDPMRKLAAALEVFSALKFTHLRPDYGIGTVESDGRTCTVREEPVLRTPFGTLLRFAKTPAVEQPKVLLVAPMSGHFATLLRNTVRTLLADHDVYITDWHNARDVPLSSGRFGLDEYVAHLIRFLETLGPRAHVVAICQPCVPALAAVSLMAADAHPCQPRTLALMAGPIDVRVNPTEVNRLANEKPYAWFEQRMIQTVPWPHPGAGRRVYPGFLQVVAFMSMNVARHHKAFLDLYEAMLDGDDQRAGTIRTFYDEYFAACDLPAEFYLDTIRRVFQDADLARGAFTVGGRAVDPSAIRRTALLTVEGERDDICSVGQTLAAQELCTNVRPYLRRHLVQTGVGHYGVFSGSKWERQIYPVLRDFIHQAP